MIFYKFVNKWITIIKKFKKLHILKFKYFLEVRIFVEWLKVKKTKIEKFR